MPESKCSRHNGRQSSAVVYLVGGGPGDPGLLTLRGLECLRMADVVVHDRLVNDLLLDFAPQAARIDVGKEPDHHPIPQDRINQILIDEALHGRTVVRLKGGDPFVFGRGGEEALALAQAGIPFEVVPGVTSAVAVPAYAGIPVTHRGLASSVAFITGHRATSDSSPDLDWLALARSVDTLVFLMGVHNLPIIVARLCEAGLPACTPVALIQQGTTPAQQVTTGTLATILAAAAEVQPPAIIVVGQVVALRPELMWYNPEAESLPG